MLNIKKLADLSFNKKELDIERVNIIKKRLKRSELKRYVKELMNLIGKNTAEVKSAIGLDDQSKKKISSLFPDKKIKYMLDPSLIMGIEISYNDNVYSLNLKNTLESLSTHIINLYD